MTRLPAQTWIRSSSWLCPRVAAVLAETRGADL